MHQAVPASFWRVKQPPPTGVLGVRGAPLGERSSAKTQHRRDLDLASDVFVELGAAKVALYAGLQWLAYGLWNSLRIVAAVRSVPTLTLDGVPRDDEIREFFGTRRWGIPVRLGVGVLVLPDDPRDYLRGRARQAVRYNCNRARERGWSYIAPIDGPERIRRIDTLLEARGAPPVYRRWLLRRVLDGQGEFRFVEDEHGGPVALGVFTVAGTVARLHWMISDGREARSAARYLLSAELAAELAARGVKHLLTDSVLFMTSGTRYFQRRLGYEPYTLVFSDRS
jgi:hypothetical protein